MKKLFAITLSVGLFASQCAAQGASADAAQSAEPQTFSSVYDAAMKGNLDMQRLLAFGFSSTPLNGQNIDPVQGCAWYIVVASSASKEVIQADAVNQKNFCGKLPPTSLTEAQANAKKLLGQIHGQ
jgi:hypothetical protein